MFILSTFILDYIIDVYSTVVIAHSLRHANEYDRLTITYIFEIQRACDSPNSIYGSNYSWHKIVRDINHVKGCNVNFTLYVPP